MGDPARHSSRNLPTLLAGAGLVGGSHVRWGPSQHPANNHLLVSICRAFGVPAESFGEAEDPALTHGAASDLWS